MSQKLNKRSRIRGANAGRCGGQSAQPVARRLTKITKLDLDEERCESMGMEVVEKMLHVMTTMKSKRRFPDGFCLAVLTSVHVSFLHCRAELSVSQ